MNEDPIEDLYKIWKTPFDQGVGWATQLYNYLEFDRDGILNMLDIEGNVVHQYEFNIDHSNKILVGDKRVFGEVLEIREEELVLLRPYYIGDKKVPKFKKELLYPKSKTEVATGLQDLNLGDYILKNAWSGIQVTQRGKMGVTLKPSPKITGLMNLEMTTWHQDLKRVRSFNACTVEFDGSYSMKFFQEKHPHLVQYLPVERITRDKIEFRIKTRSENERLVVVRET